MEELKLYGKVVNTNKIFPSNNPHKKISRPCQVNIQQIFNTHSNRLTNNCLICDNITTGRTVILNCGVWFKNEIVVGM